MRLNVLISLAAAAGSVHAQLPCIADSPFTDCTSSALGAYITSCSAPSTLSIPALITCECDPAGLEYSCAKTHCPTETSLQSSLLDLYTGCLSNNFADFTTMSSGGEQQTAITQMSSSVAPSTTDISTPSSTVASSGPNTTAAPGTATSAATGQAKTSTAAANPAPASNDGLGGIFAFVAGIAALL